MESLIDGTKTNIDTTNTETSFKVSYNYLLGSPDNKDGD